MVAMVTKIAIYLHFTRKKQYTCIGIGKAIFHEFFYYIYCCLSCFFSFHLWKASYLLVYLYFDQRKLTCRWRNIKYTICFVVSVPLSAIMFKSEFIIFRCQWKPMQIIQMYAYLSIKSCYSFCIGQFDLWIKIGGFLCVEISNLLTIYDQFYIFFSFMMIQGVIYTFI